MPYSNAADNFQEARNFLDAADQSSYALTMGAALRACAAGMGKVFRIDLDPEAQGRFRMMDFMIESAGLTEADPLEAWSAKAGSFDPDQIEKLSVLIDDLLAWFRDHSA